MVTIDNKKSVGANEAQAFGSFAVSLADDESAMLLLPVDYGHVLLAEASANSHGMAWVRANASVKYFGGINFDVVLNTPLLGTTGTDGKITISTSGGNFYVENRLGAAIVLSITFFGMSLNRI